MHHKIRKKYNFCIWSFWSGISQSSTVDLFYILYDIWYIFLVTKNIYISFISFTLFYLVEMNKSSGMNQDYESILLSPFSIIFLQFNTNIFIVYFIYIHAYFSTFILQLFSLFTSNSSYIHIYKIWKRFFPLFNPKLY